MNVFSNSSPKKRKVNTNSKNDGSTAENHDFVSFEIIETKNELIHVMNQDNDFSI